MTIPTGKRLLGLLDYLRRKGFTNNVISYFLKEHGFSKLGSLAKMAGLGNPLRRVGKRKRKRKPMRGRGGLISGSVPRFWVDRLGRPIMFKTR